MLDKLIASIKNLISILHMIIKGLIAKHVAVISVC